MKRGYNLTILLMVLFMLVACSQSQGAENTQEEVDRNDSGFDQPQQEQDEHETNFPEKDIELMIFVGPTGVVDASARIVADNISKYLPNNVKMIPVNRPGGSGSVAIAELMNKKPDGYTVAIAGAGQLVTQPLLGTAPYTLDDFEYILNIVSTPLTMVDRKDSPWQNYEEWLKHIQDHPGEVKVGVVGRTASGPLALERFKLHSNLEFELIPYDSGGPALTALLAGEIDVALLSDATIAGVEEVRPLFTIAPERLSGSPDVPSINEQNIVEGDFGTWISLGIIAPKGVPEAHLRILHDAFKAALEDEDSVQKLTDLGIEILYLDSEGFRQLMDQEWEETEELLKELDYID